MDENRYYYCRVQPKDYARSYSYLGDPDIHQEGMYVLIPFGTDNRLVKGLIIQADWYSLEDAPWDPSITKHIHSVITKEEYLTEPAEEAALDEEELEELEWLEDAIADGELDTVFEWAAQHHDAIDKPLIMQRVVQAYEICLEAGGAIAAYAAVNLGTLYYTGTYLPRDYKRAAELYAIGVRSGRLRAICNLGYCYYYGRHQAVDYGKAYELFSLGALLHNDANCLYKLGDMYRNGYHVKKNIDYALRLYERAYEILHSDDSTDRGHMADVQYRLGECALYGLGRDRDILLAHGLLQSALQGFYNRRKTDPFIGELITNAKRLIAEAEVLMDAETLSL